MKVSLGHQTSHQIIFAGPFGVGKTTALQNISDIEVVNTDVQSLEATLQMKTSGKKTTTVGFDYGEVNIPGGDNVALIGLPGQSRFDGVWDVFLGKNSGVVLWLYGDDENALQDCEKWLNHLKKRNAVTQLTVAITRLPEPAPDNLLQPFREIVLKFNPYAPVITADPRNRNQVVQAVLIAISTPSYQT